ncbi:MAG TPA: formylglycine-generating enzyme family protein [Steroidobacteraceae bacterium]|nr:formylglycine-generating enzyme family protein [Steroidobacteraceae bacterium]HRX89392.1 formylglycine-generating enzyme family protein [Steroidobacteraceae bacterium]
MKIRSMSVAFRALAAFAFLFVASDSQSRDFEPGTEFSDCDGCPVMVVVPGGRFQMGSLEGETGRFEGPIHEVRIGYDFAVGKFEVTYAQFAEFVRAAGHVPAERCIVWTDKWEALDDTSWRNPGYGRAPLGDEPVGCISWNDAKAYVAWLADKTGAPYRLLSESEWEYAARGGTSTRYYWGDDADDICVRANLFDASGRRASDLTYVSADCDDGYPFTAPVGSFPPNPFGIHDITGNVWEWTEDCYAMPYPAGLTDGRSHQVDGECELRSIRGGGWITSVARQRPAFRGRDPAPLVFAPFGLRVARDLR